MHIGADVYGMLDSDSSGFKSLLGWGGYMYIGADLYCVRRG
jgi:hypothetical protein